MKKALLTLSGLALAGSLSAQLYITGGRFDPTSVTYEGIAVGSSDQNQPFFLWNTQLDTYTYIGGMSAGDGVGGVPRFADSGKLIAGSMPCDSIPVTTAWQRSSYPDFACQFRAFHKVSDYMFYAVGRNEDGTKGIILLSYNNGVTWKDATDVEVNIEGGLECISSLGYTQILAGGHNGKMYASYGNYTWTEVDIRPEGDATKVKTYWAIDFIVDPDGRSAQSGVVGLEAEDGTPAVWYTEDAGENWFAAEGVAGIPAHITHAGNTYYMVTQNGHIQQSTDGGISWTTLFSLEGGSFYRIRFADELKGIALTDNVAYITRDGGANWTKTEILPSISIGPLGSVAWNDAVWQGETILVAGPSNLLFLSTDDGANFDKLNIDLEYSNNFGCVFFDQGAYNVGGSDGRFYRKSDVTSKQGYTAGLYNVETYTWTPLQSSGYDDQSVCSAPWQISGDGQTVVGNAYFLYPKRNNIQAHAAVWSTNYTLFDLGSKFADKTRYSTAMASNYDGSVIVGWQDIFGPRFGAVWTKGADGNYTQRMMLHDSDLNEDDIDYNDKDACYKSLLATCRCVSPDGKWIGGDGNSVSALPGAWVWNAEDGYIQITDIDGGTAEVFNDGSKAIGWEGLGQNAWLWTKQDGITFLNQWAMEKGLLDNGFVIMSAYDMSPNGRYITGYGVFDGTDVRGYVLDLEAANTGIHEKAASQVKAAVYPNPVATELHIDLPYSSSELATTIALHDLSGRTVAQLTDCAQSNVIPVGHLPEGIYLLSVSCGKQTRSQKVIVTH